MLARFGFDCHDRNAAKTVRLGGAIQIARTGEF